MPSIDYYFTSISPFAYLGNIAIREVADKHGCDLNIKPVNIFGLWEESGAVPPAKRPPVRQKMRLLELQRMSIHRSRPLNLSPAHFPVDPTLADCTIIALMQAGEDVSGYMDALLAGVWADERDISDETALAQLLTDAGHDATSVLERAKAEESTAIRQKNTTDAIAANAPGVPAYVLNGECFWGQDRIEFIDEALKSGRDPLTA